MVKTVISDNKGLVQYGGQSGVDIQQQNITSPGLKHMGYVDNTAAFVRDSDSTVAWTQPANTVLWSISLICTSAPTVTITSTDLGYGVGTSDGGAEIVAAITDEIIDGAASTTPLAVGAFLPVAGPGTLGSTKTIAHIIRVATSATTLAADVNYTATARSLYFNTTCNDHAVATAGTMRWLIEYIQVA